MSRRGDNIHKRKDGRWEGRYISGRKLNGRAKYSSVYVKSFKECAEKLTLARCGLLTKPKPVTVAELFSEWLMSRKNIVKQSSYVCYRNMYQAHIDAPLGKCRGDALNSFELNRFADTLIHSGGHNGRALSPRTVQAVMIMLRSVLRYGAQEYGLANAAGSVSLPKAVKAETTLFNQAEIRSIKRESL